MNTLTPKQLEAVVAGMTQTDVESLVTEIADYQLTIDGLTADRDAIYRKLDERKARLAARLEPKISSKNEAILQLERSLNERLAVVEKWAELHKAVLFKDPRSLKCLRGVIGFKDGPPKVTFLKGVTVKMAAFFLRRRTWGRGYLKPAEIDRQAILRDEAAFAAQPDRLDAVGLAITRQEIFYVNIERSSSDLDGKGAA